MPDRRLPPVYAATSETLQRVLQLSRHPIGGGKIGEKICSYALLNKKKGILLGVITTFI